MAVARRPPARGVARAFVVVLLACLAVLLGDAIPAGAQDEPPPPTPSSPATTATTSAPPTTTSLPPVKATPANRLVPGGQYGDFPLDAYDFMYSTNEDGKDDLFGLNIPGVNLDMPVPTSQEQGRRTITGMIGSWAFAATVTIVKLALLIVGWAFNFPLLGLLADLVHDVVQRLEGQFIGPAGIRIGVAALAAFIAGWYLLTARLVHGLREALIGVVMIALAGMMVANIDRYYNAASEFGAGISSVIVGLAGNSEASGVDAVQQGMAQALVAEPWALLNYGTPLEGACAQAGREILSTGPHGTDGAPRQLLREAGCDTEAAFNQNPTTERAIDAGLLFLGVLPAALFMVLVAFTLLIAQFRLAIAFVMAPGAMLLGAIASTRHLAGRWALFAVKALLGIVAPVVVLSAMALIDLLILTGIDFSVTVGGVRIDLIAKLVLINAANFALWVKRRAVADGIYRATTVKADRALVKAGVPTAAPELSKPLAARLEKGSSVMPGMRDPLAAAANRTKTAVGGAKAGTAKVATTAASFAAGPAGRGSVAAAAVLGVAQKTAVATGGPTVGSDGRPTGTASGGGARRPGASSPVGAAPGAGGGSANGTLIGTVAPPATVPVVLPSAAFATAAAANATGGGADGRNGHGVGFDLAPPGPGTPGGLASAPGANGWAHGPGGPPAGNGSASGNGLPLAAAAAGAMATAVAPVGPRAGIGHVADQPIGGGPWSGFDGRSAGAPSSPAPGVDGGTLGSWLDPTALPAPIPGASTPTPRPYPIPAPPPPGEPVSPRRVAAYQGAGAPVEMNPIGPIPPPPDPPPRPRGGDAG